MKTENYDLFGNKITDPKRTMSDYFGVAPFSILNTVDGDWQKRKKRWNVLINDKGQAREGVLGHSQWLEETNPNKLKDKFNELLILSDFGVLSFQEHYFKPQGWTGLWLLSESHFAIHTFPEENKTYIELSSCNEEKQIYFVNNI